MERDINYKDASVVFGIAMSQISMRISDGGFTANILNAVKDIEEVNPNKTHIILRDLPNEKPEFLVQPGILRFKETNKGMLPLIINPYSDLMLTLTSKSNPTFLDCVDLIKLEMPRTLASLDRVGSLLIIGAGTLLSKAEIAQFPQLTIKNIDFPSDNR